MVKKKQQTRIQSAISSVAPTSIKDTLIRAIKTAVAAALTGFPLNTIASYDLSAWKVLAFTAATAGGSVILNALLSWANTSE